MTSPAAPLHPAQAIAGMDWLPTDRLASMALTWPAHSSNQHGLAEVWQVVSTSEEDAEAYYSTLPADQLRMEAAEALAAAGWTRSSIAFRLS